MQERKPKQLRARHKAGEGRKPEVEPQGRENDEDKIEKRTHKGQGLRRTYVAHLRRDHDTRQAGFDERADVTPQLWNIAGQTAYERAGFRRLGIRRGAVISRGRPTDVVIMDAVPQDFGASVLR